MIKAKALSEEECVAATLPPVGVFKFVVVNTLEKDSPKVGKFLSLKIKLLLPNNRERTIYDNLFFFDEMFWKTRHFYNATGMMDKYMSETFLAQDCDLAEGYLEIAHKTNKKTGEIESYVKDYLLPENAAAPAADDFNDDIPNM